MLSTDYILDNATAVNMVKGIYKENDEKKLGS